MTDKQLDEKKKEFEDLVSTELQTWYRIGLDDGFKIDDEMILTHKEMVEEVIKKTPSEKLWIWILELVEEVEREAKEIDKELMEKVADSDYKLGFIRGTQTSESLTSLEISEHEEEREKIRDEMMKRFYN